jgi:hypothetical protein
MDFGWFFFHVLLCEPLSLTLTLKAMEICCKVICSIHLKHLGGLYNSAFQFYKGGNFVINGSSYIKMALGTSPKWLLHNTKMAKYV